MKKLYTFISTLIQYLRAGHSLSYAYRIAHDVAFLEVPF